MDTKYKQILEKQIYGSELQDRENRDELEILNDKVSLSKPEKARKAKLEEAIQHDDELINRWKIMLGDDGWTLKDSIRQEVLDEQLKYENDDIKRIETKNVRVAEDMKEQDLNSVYAKRIELNLNLGIKKDSKGKEFVLEPNEENPEAPIPRYLDDTEKPEKVEEKYQEAMQGINYEVAGRYNRKLLLQDLKNKESVWLK